MKPMTDTVGGFFAAFSRPITVTIKDCLFDIDKLRGCHINCSLKIGGKRKLDFGTVELKPIRW